MEYGRPRSDEARARRRADTPVARSLRTGRSAALQPRQMVPGRAASALGLRALLAPRWRSDLARRKVDRARDRDADAIGAGYAAFRRRDCDASGNHGGLRAARL